MTLCCFNFGPMVAEHQNNRGSGCIYEVIVDYTLF